MIEDLAPVLALLPLALVVVLIAVLVVRRKNKKPDLKVIRDDIAERPINGRYAQEVDECKKEKSEISDDAIGLRVSAKHFPKRKKKRKPIRGKRK